MKLSEYMYIMKVLERLNLEDKYANLEISDVVKRNNENYGTVNACFIKCIKLRIIYEK